ncbi:MAG: two-component system response regulator [Candidatus Rokuibacteriota bacterium]|nr:MAG: two-component system response regulator [Candidatus Rokubacteria bacterium]
MPKSSRTSVSQAESVHGEEALGRILVVDDDVDVRWTLTDHLQSQGYTVTAVADAEQALAAMRSERPDLILLDLLLPGTNGLQVLQRVRQDDPTLSVVVMTGLEDDGLSASTIRLGAILCLRKPFGLDRLDRAVRSGVGLRRKSAPPTRARSR